jgi:hypothetical protein
MPAFLRLPVARLPLAQVLVALKIDKKGKRFA